MQLRLEIRFSDALLSSVPKISHLPDEKHFYSFFRKAFWSAPHETSQEFFQRWAEVDVGGIMKKRG